SRRRSRNRSAGGCRATTPSSAATASASPTPARPRGGSSTPTPSRSSWPSWPDSPARVRSSGPRCSRPPACTRSTTSWRRRHPPPTPEWRDRAGGKRGGAGRPGAGAPADDRPVSDALLKRITRYSGTLSTDAVRALEVELPFFAELSADQRAEIQLIIQSAVRDFVTWMRNPEAQHTDTIAGFKL